MVITEGEKVSDLRFIRFGTVHPCAQHTNTSTQRDEDQTRPRYIGLRRVAINRIYTMCTGDAA